MKVETVYDKVTVVNCKLPNGFVITVASGAVDPANYDEEIGKEICLSRIENKLWELEGYALAKKIYESEE
ncbi:MAG: Gp49 family protein [Ruminococcus sp.]